MSSLLNLSYSIVGQIAFGISYIIAYIAGVVIAIEAWLVGVVLSINSGVFSSAVVQNGFSATLALANLGFVLGIIVVALATILRSETYGIKKILGKLIAAAILVNFSLVIMAPIFNFGNSLTQYFLNCVDPAGGGCTSASSGFTSMNDFAKNLAGAFNPQRGFLNNDLNAGGGAGSFASIQSGFSSAGSDISKMLIPITSIVFVAVQLVMIVVVLGSLIVMLLIRYLYIAILAILMPFAWLMWIFPGMEHHWKKWWSEFIHWTMFAPIVVFFLWLAMTTMTAMNNSAVGGSQSFATYTTNANPLMASLSGFGSGLLIPIIQNFLNMIIMVGLSLGGMMVANSLGLKGADAVVKGGTKTAKAIGGFTWKQTKKGGRATFRRAGGENTVAKMRSGQIGSLKKIPLVGGAASWVSQKTGATWAATRVASLAGRAVEPHLSNKDIVEEAKKKVSDNPEVIKQNLKANMNTEDRIAHIQKLIDKGEMTSDVMVGNQAVQKFMDANKSLLSENYGQGKLVKDADKVFGGTKEMREAAEELKNAADDISKETARKKLDLQTQEYVGKLQKSDISKMNVNDVFGKDTELSRALSRTFAKSAPQFAAAALPKMKGASLKTFSKVYREEIESEQNKGPYVQKVASVNANTTLTQKEKGAVIAKLTMTDEEKTLARASKYFESALGSNATFSTPEGSSGETPAAPAAH